MNPLVKLAGIGKEFDNGTKAIARLDLDVNEGEFLSLLGPSGCGKSTALRVVAGLLQPTTCSVAFPHGRPEIGFVFQEPTLMPWASALTNVRLPLDLKHLNASEASDRAAKALARVGLQGFESAFPRELSGGMKMRVSIARAIAAEPKLLLMDEPFAALDEPMRESLNDDLLRLWREDSLTVVFVTHSVYESAFLSTRVMVMTPRPGRNLADIELSPPFPRGADYRLSADFSESAKRIAAVLKREHELETA